MNCISLWYEPKEKTNKKKIDLEVHLNLWKINKSKYFLDIGIRIEKTKNIKKLNIHIPSENITNEDIKDLGKIISENDILLNAVFNDNYKRISDSEKKWSCVYKEKSESENIEFNIYHIDINQDIKIKKCYDGTKIVIKNKMSEEKPLYYRIRIDNSKEIQKIFSSLQDPKNNIFENAFSKFEIFDLRVNEIRNIDKTLNETINKQGQFNFKKIHFFLMIDSKNDYLFSHQPVKDCRVLENHIWSKYIGELNAENEKILAYHWKEPININDKLLHYKALVKIQFKNYHKFKIIKYFLFLAFFSIIFNISSNFIYDDIKSPVKKCIKECINHFCKKEIIEKNVNKDLKETEKNDKVEKNGN